MTIDNPLRRGPGTSGRLVIGGPPVFEFVRGYLATELEAPATEEEVTNALLDIWDYNDDDEWVQNPRELEGVELANHDPTLVGEVGAFVMAMKWYYTRPDGSLNTEWVPFWVGCPNG